MKDWESPLLEQDNEWSSSFEKVNFLLFFFFKSSLCRLHVYLFEMFLYSHLLDALPESDAAITSHLVKPETQQLECKSAFPDQKVFLYIL